MLRLGYAMLGCDALAACSHDALPQAPQRQELQAHSAPTSLAREIQAASAAVFRPDKLHRPVQR